MTECPATAKRINKPWTAKRALLLGFLTGAFMCCPVIALYWYDEQQQWNVSVGAFITCFLTLTVGLPLGTLIKLSPRIRNPRAGLPYCLGCALGAAALWWTDLLWDLFRREVVLSSRDIGVGFAEWAGGFFVYFCILWLAVLGVALLLRVLGVLASERASAACTCSSCGYYLMGNLSGVCPECGTPVPPAASKT
jgi:hypothetical protein